MAFLTVVGVVLVLGSHTVSAAALDPLLRAAGLSPAPQPVAADDFELPDVTGQRHRLRDQLGKVVFLNFWATWCPPCRQEMPLMDQVYQSLRQRPFVMWAVNIQESREQVAQFMTEQRLQFPALLDADGTVSALYKVRGLPTTYLIDCAGNVAGWALGPREWSDDATRTLLAALLNDPACQRSSGDTPTPRSEQGS